MDPQQAIDRAREMYVEPSDNDIVIYDNADTEKTEFGTWVQAWCWVPDGEV